jgi:hypothetical protein
MASWHFDGARLLLADLGVEQIADDTLGFVLAFDGRGHNLFEGGLHAVELEFAEPPATDSFRYAQ